FFFSMLRHRPLSTLFPYTTLFRSDVVLSNLEKIFWPEEKYTKGDLIEYYRAISPWLLPYLKDRPVVLTRFPDGITGKSFFQKDRSEEHTSELQSRSDLVCRLLLEK